jgi:hypothetical protein
VSRARFRQAVSIVFSMWYILCGAVVVSQALTQQDVYRLGINYYDVDDSQSACAGTGSGDTTLVGSDNATKAWNFFKAQNFDDTHVAAILGNLQQESGINPTLVEGNNSHPELPKNSTDPAGLPVVDGWPGGQTRQPGWGLAQWTPSAKVINTARGLNITTNIGDIGTQLNIILGEMKGTTPTGKTGFVEGFTATTNLADATQYFVHYYEGPLIVGPRLTYAQQFLTKYGGTVPTGTPTTDVTGSSGSDCSSLPPDCSTANGLAKILCAAKAYDTASYLEASEGGHQGGEAWHQTCPTIGPSCHLDCSGLVNIAVYDTFNVDLRENTGSERADIGKYWKVISLSDLQPGDLVQPNPGHVEIIDHVQGGVLYTFAAHTSYADQTKDVGPSQYRASSGMLFLRYIGPGV